MKKISMLLLVRCLGLLFAASTCFAQMYTATDLGTLGGSSSTASGINASGQVVGWAFIGGNTAYHAFRTAPNSAINPATDDLGTLGGSWSRAMAVNASGQVVGWAFTSDNSYHAFRTAPNRAINPATDDLVSPCTLDPGLNICVGEAFANDINDSGQVVGWVVTFCCNDIRAFRAAPNSPIVPLDDFITNDGAVAYGINASGQVVGVFNIFSADQAFRTAPGSFFNSVTDDLGTLASGGVNLSTQANAINDLGQVVGSSDIGDNAPFPGTLHAFRTAPNRPIHPATDDLGPGNATGIDNFGQVVGGPLYSNGEWHNLNDLVAAGSGCASIEGVKINNAGQIAANGNCNGQAHAILLTPIYKAFVHSPIHADGSSVFAASRGVVPVKFTLTQQNAPTCALLPATIALVRTAGEPRGPVDESVYATNGDDGSNFRIDPSACQYVYDLRASALGAGSYRVDISINGIFVGHAMFALK